MHADDNRSFGVSMEQWTRRCALTDARIIYVPVSVNPKSPPSDSLAANSLQSTYVKLTGLTGVAGFARFLKPHTINDFCRLRSAIKSSPIDIEPSSARLQRRSSTT
jgi:hypothetical protein